MTPARQVFQILTFLAGGVPAIGIEDPERAAAALAAAVQGFVGQDKSLQLSEGHMTRLREILSVLARRTSELNRAVNTRRVVRGVLPMFESLDATAELRSTRSPFDAGPDGDDAFGLVPRASLRLRLDSGDRPEIYFQATEADLAVWIERLQRLQSALAKLKENVSVRELPHA